MCCASPSVFDCIPFGSKFPFLTNQSIRLLRLIYYIASNSDTLSVVYTWETALPFVYCKMDHNSGQVSPSLKVIQHDSVKPYAQRKLIHINDVCLDLVNKCRQLQSENKHLRSLVKVLLNFKHILLFLKQQMIDEIECKLDHLSVDFHNNLQICTALYNEFSQQGDTGCNGFVQENESKFGSHGQLAIFDTHGDVVTLKSLELHFLESSFLDEGDPFQENNSPPSERTFESVIQETIFGSDVGCEVEDVDLPDKATNESTLLDGHSHEMLSQVQSELRIKVDFFTIKHPDISLFYDTHENEKKEFLCKIPSCEYKSNVKPLIVTHVFKHLNMKPFECLQCSYVTDSLKCLNSHQTVKHNAIPNLRSEDYAKFFKVIRECDENHYYCQMPNCTYASKLRDFIVSHINKHISLKPYECKYCARTFTSRKLARSHLYAFHVERRSKVPSYLNCPYPSCDHIIADKELNLMLSHIVQLHPQNFITPSKGFKSKLTPSLLKAKMQKILSKESNSSLTTTIVSATTETSPECSPSIADPSQKPLNSAVGRHSESKFNFYCSYLNCKFQTNSKTQLKAHELRKHTRQGFNCPQPDCNLKPDDPISLHLHLLNTHNMTIFRCLTDGCNLNFISKTDWTSHSKEAHRFAICNVCGKNIRSSQIARHFNKFHLVNDYHCKVENCNFKCSLKKDMLNHTNRVHRRVKCPHDSCGIVLNRASLRFHMNRHNRDRKYVCTWPNCVKGFFDSSSLRNHMAIHTNTRQYRCSWPGCGYSSQQRSNVKKHIRIRHFKVSQRSSVKEHTNAVDASKYVIRVIDDAT